MTINKSSKILCVGALAVAGAFVAVNVYDSKQEPVTNTTDWVIPVHTQQKRIIANFHQPLDVSVESKVRTILREKYDSDANGVYETEEVARILGDVGYPYDVFEPTRFTLNSYYERVEFGLGPFYEPVAEGGVTTVRIPIEDLAMRFGIDYF